jgi:ribonuclease-3
MAGGLGDKPVTVLQNSDAPLRELQDAIGYVFRQPDLLVAALSHSSLEDRTSSLTNERLEFLGDAVLNIVVSRYLFEHFPEQDEGGLSKMRSILVSKKSLSRAAQKIGLGRYLRLGKGQERMQGRINASILCNALQSLFGALVLDSNLEVCAALVKQLILADSHATIRDKRFQNYKSALLEHTQRTVAAKPVYELVKTKGPEHEKIFVVNVKLKNKILGTGTGPNKKEAEQEAARDALERLEI